MRSSAEELPRDVRDLEVLEIGMAVPVERAPWTVVLDPDGVEVHAVTNYLLQLEANDCSRDTIRAYAMSLLRFMRFLWAIDVTWQRASSTEARDFVLWARQARKFEGNRRAHHPRTQRNLVTGKRYQSPNYAPTTINHTLTVSRAFYAYHLERGQGPVLNPFDLRRGTRRHEHHNPELEFQKGGRDPLRQKVPKRTPRAMPDDRFNAVFRKLRCNRDRALVAFYVSSGARAQELLGLTGSMIDVGEQLIGVVRKGGDLQWIPAAPDAFVWLRLYELERGPVGPDDPVWLTLRGEPRRLSYDAMRGVLSRVNATLGANWSLHDLRHTFSVRALEGGMGVHELQVLLGHAHLQTTSVYTTPGTEDVIQHFRAAFAGPGPQKPQPPAEIPYDQDELDLLFGDRT